MGISRVSQVSGAPKPVMVGGIQPELPLPTGEPLPFTPVQAACLYLSHQVQVIHVAAAPGLPVCTSARPGYHDNGMQGTRASVGCGSWRAVPWAREEACFFLLWEAWQGLEPGGGGCALCVPSLPLCFGISFLPSVLGAGGGARVPFLVGGVQEQMGERNSPSHLGCAPTAPKW